MSIEAGNSLRNKILEQVSQYYQTVHMPEQLAEKNALPYSGRVFNEQELINLVDASLDFWLTTGRYAKQFEREFSNYLGLRYALLTNSGSSANLLALMALTSPILGDRQLLPGDEVITVAAGFPTTIAPIIQYGAVPVFIDISLPTYNIDTALLEQGLSEKTKAVMIAHTMGNPFNLDAVTAFCKKNNLWLVEDNCDALGAEYYLDNTWRKTGTIGDLGTSSFYPPHHMTMGEGGCVYTDNGSLKRIVESFRDWGRDCWCASGQDNTCSKRFEWSLGELPDGYDHKYIYSHFGYNLKVTDMQAAIGCAQLEKLPFFIEQRNANWLQLKNALKPLEAFFVLPEPTVNSKPSWFGFLLTLKPEAPFSRPELISYLESKKIQTRLLFAGNIIKQPCFNEMRANQKGYRIASDLKNTNLVMENSFLIGVYPGLQSINIDFMASQITEFCKPFL